MITVVKVGGSLYELPDFGPRLRRWLANQPKPLVLVPGGGRTADVVRFLDQQHQLGEEKAHWLALRALSLNAHFLAALLPESQVVCDIRDPQNLFYSPVLSILDMMAFALTDDERPDHLPHCWDATSDSLALRVAIRLEASALVLLKALPIPAPVDWEEASRRGWVDPYFPQLLRTKPLGLEVRAVSWLVG